MNRVIQIAFVAIVVVALAAGLWGRRARPVQLSGRPQAPAAAMACDRPATYAGAAAKNAASLTSAAWSVFGRPEVGWGVYAPLTGHEIGTSCPATTPAFAMALATWQARNRQNASGAMEPATLNALRLVWLARRPFVAASAHGACPPATPASALLLARPQEGYEGMAIRLRPQALVAWRAMAAAARAEAPTIAADPRLLTIFSGFRDPAADAVRCASQGCSAITRASCSAHRTGLALDLYLGAAPGFPPASSADANRLYQSRTVAYRWLVANAARFGFVNYPFEPWHWEWAGPESGMRSGGGA